MRFSAAVAGFPLPARFLRRCGFAGILLASPLCAQQPQPFTLQQILSAPYTSELTAAPAGSLFAWVENAEGRRNLFIGDASTPARQLTHNTEDDGQDIDNLAWSPDASAIAYTYGAPSGADGKPANPAHLQHPTPLTVIVQPLASNAPPVVIGEGRVPLYTHDGSSLLYLHDGQIWIAELSERKQCMLPEGCPTAPANPATPTHQLVYDRGSASQLTLSPDGNTLAFISRRRELNELSHTLLALYNLSTHTLTFPSPSTSNDSEPAFSPDGKQLAWLRAPFTDTPEYANPRTSPNPWSIQLLDLGTNTARTVYSPEPNKPGSVLPHLATGEPRLFFATGKRISFTSEADGWVHLYSMETSGLKSPTLLTPGKFEVEDASLSHDGRQLFYASNQIFGRGSDEKRLLATGVTNGTDDLRRIWKLDLTKTGSLPEVFVGDIYDIATHPQPAADGSALVALVANAWWPMAPAIISPNGSATPINAAKVKDVPNFNILLSPPSQVTFPSADQLDIHAQIFLPHEHYFRQTPDAQPNKHPAILFVHGGPNRQMLLGYPAMDYYSNAYAMNQYLASRGFIVLSVNYRGGIGYGLNFREAEHYGPNGASEYKDVLAAAKYLQSRPDVDPKRIGIWGGSYGGYLTALALARNSDIFAAGVDFHGVHNWNLEDNASDWRRGSNAERDAIAAKAFASSPMADIDHWKSPVLLIHGDNDPEVAYAQTPLLADALRARHVPVEELIFPDEVHDFLLHRDWLAAYNAAAAFFERTLQPDK